MAGFIKVEVEKLPVQQINQKINKEIFTEFQKKCKQQNIPMNVIMTTFCRQYANGNYVLSESNILKWENDSGDVSTLNTPISKEVYQKFKDKVKSDGHFVKHILAAFIEDYAKNDLFMEFTNRNV